MNANWKLEDILRITVSKENARTCIKKTGSSEERVGVVLLKKSLRSEDQRIGSEIE